MSDMQREVDEVLQNAKEPSAAASWREACRCLAGPLRVAVAARRVQAADRLARKLDADGTRTAVVGLGDEAAIGTEEPILASHALVWPTPYTGALGNEERDSLDALAAFAPRRRAVVIVDKALLQRVSDDPTREASDVRARVQALLPRGWDLLDEDELPAWLASVGSQLSEVVAERQQAVAAYLLEDARARATASIARMADELARTTELLGAEESKLEAARKQGARIAAHVLGAMRKQTEGLLIDLREFLLTLENDLPAQVEGVSDVATVRHTLPHWLDHVIERWVGERLAEWRLGVLEDLEGFRLSEHEASSAELVAPALYAAPMRDDSGWVHRIVVSAAVGGGAALLLVGLWIPAAVAVSGGLAWQTLGRRGRDSETRTKLVEQATTALREMGREAERLLREQIDRIEAELDKLADERAAAVAAERGELRKELEEQAALQRARLSEQRRIGDDLAARAGTLLE